MGPVTESLYSQRLIAANERERQIARAARLGDLRRARSIEYMDVHAGATVQRGRFRRRFPAAAR
jgi:hypothetical protein